jgi:hypothetical protein
MANNTNCEPCNITATVPVAPPPVCPVPACEELVPTECVVNNLLNDDCTTQFYQYGTDGELLTNNGQPIPQSPPVPLGLTITQGQSLNTILTNMMSPQNCSFNPDFIAGMLQVIQANPQHPVSQIFCNLVCSCVCDVPCDPNLTVEQVVFSPIGQTQVTFTFYAEAGVTYDFVFVNTTVTPPVQSTYTGYQASPGNALVTINTNTLAGFDPLEPDSRYQLFINAYTDEGESCPNGSWFFRTTGEPTCECDDVVITLSFEPGATTIAFDILLSLVPGQIVPEGYMVTITQGTTSPTQIYGPSFVPIELPGNATPFSYGGTLVNDTYTVYVEPVCTQVPPCFGIEIQETIEITGVIVCDPPVITGVSIG